VLYFLTRYPARLALTDFAHWRIRIAKGLLLILAMATGTIQRASGFAGREEKHSGWLVKRARDPAHCRAHSKNRSAIRAELGLRTDRLLVGIFGGINVRKNPPMVLNAVVHTGLPADLLMAGPVDEQMRSWLDGLDPSLRERVIVADGFLPDELLDKYLAASDVVALVMSLEGPSGIQGKAAAAGVPIVTAGSRTRARERTPSGRGVATALELTAVVDGLRRVLTNVGGCATVRPGLPLPTHESFAATILGID
jgi:glycosyltransferase involved in cell wall biosynthesis